MAKTTKNANGLAKSYGVIFAPKMRRSDFSPTGGKKLGGGAPPLFFLFDRSFFSPPFLKEEQRQGGRAGREKNAPRHFFLLLLRFGTPSFGYRDAGFDVQSAHVNFHDDWMTMMLMTMIG